MQRRMSVRRRKSYTPLSELRYSASPRETLLNNKETKKKTSNLNLGSNAFWRSSIETPCAELFLHLLLELRSQKFFADCSEKKGWSDSPSRPLMVALTGIRSWCISQDYPLKAQEVKKMMSKFLLVSWFGNLDIVTHFIHSPQRRSLSTSQDYPQKARTFFLAEKKRLRKTRMFLA